MHIILIIMVIFKCYFSGEHIAHAVGKCFDDLVEEDIVMIMENDELNEDDLIKMFSKTNTCCSNPDEHEFEPIEFLAKVISIEKN